MEKPDVFMPLYIGDYLAGTSRLTTELHGAYMLLIMDYWMNGPLPDNDSILASIAKMQPDAWSNARASLKHYFSIEDGCWKHKRVEQELGKAYDKKRQAKEKAERAAAARWKGKDKGKQEDSDDKGNQESPEDSSSNASSSPPSNAPGNASSTTQAMHEECPSPSPSPSPSPDTPSEYEREGARAKSGNKFLMTQDWTPDPDTWAANCKRAGAKADYEEFIHEFRLYWSGEGRAFNEAQWQGKLINTIKRDYQKTKIIRGTDPPRSQITDDDMEEIYAKHASD